MATNKDVKPILTTQQTLCIFGVLVAICIGWVMIEHDRRNEITRQAIAAFEAKDLQKGVRLSQNANRNNPTIQVWLGFCYMLGCGGVIEDHKAGFEWYKKAALQGDKRGQASLARCYYRGIGTTLNHAKAAEWYRKSAEQRWSPSQYALGVCLYEGNGVSKDLHAAVEWWKKSAAQDFDEAQYRLGQCYIKGEGVKQDASLGIQWLNKAAEKEHAGAQRVLGNCYYHGVGVERNLKEARRWYNKAIKQNDAEAQKDLAILEQKEIEIQHHDQMIAKEKEMMRREKERQKHIDELKKKEEERIEELKRKEEERKRRYPIEQAERAKYAETKLSNISFDMNSYFHMQNAAERYLYSAVVTERKWIMFKELQKLRNWLGMLREIADCEIKDYPSPGEIDGYVAQLMKMRFHAEFLFTHRGNSSWFSMVAGEFVFAEDGCVACDLVSNCGDCDFESGSLIVSFSLSDKKEKFVYATHSEPDEESCLNERKEKMGKIEKDLRLGRITHDEAYVKRLRVREEFKRNFIRWLATSKIPQLAFTEKIR